MSQRIISVRAKEAKLPLVILTVESEGKRTKYTITEGTYREIGCPLSGEEIDSGALECIEREDEQRRAVAKALSLLSYTDNNKKRLYSKLVMAGFSSNAAANAVKECVMYGYINEERQIENLVLRYHRELNGPSRIFAKLSARGYDSKQIRKVIARLTESGEVDFESAKQELIEKKLGCDASEEDVKKLLYKNGYSYHD